MTIHQDPELVLTLQRVIEFIGTFAFALSGIRLAASKHYDWLGGFVCGVAVAIGGGTIRVLQKDTAVILGLFRTTPGRARIGSIEGDDIELENVEAEIVRGKYVRIGHGCRIGTVEYGENLEAEPGTVSRSTQTGAK